MVRNVSKVCNCSWCWWEITVNWVQWSCARKQPEQVCLSPCLNVWWCLVFAPSDCRCSTGCTLPCPLSLPTSSMKVLCKMEWLLVWLHITHSVIFVLVVSLAVFNSLLTLCSILQLNVLRKVWTSHGPSLINQCSFMQQLARKKFQALEHPI